ncbi:signal recognition particle-docking protein FtsY [Algiphilus sp.]|uniref:signal recognition particle-docking protein FtsY n=1 Tax=Algiphilus sp. TaxID=1872431 RepID=UPI001CA6DCC8|nr:signal recognition particle-docking protein FtsY [Algiphilus sp.]MBY8964930.1 signal recognition particle-docking protein FtsY [Algiphilus acroporae]MCI5104310.1 signal recognition particle-docking protein FtsY [Algiphilus sp.]
MSNESLVKRMRAQLNRGDSWLTYDLNRLFTRDKLDEAALEEIEMRLLGADAGIEATEWLVDKLRADVLSSRVKTAEQLRERLCALLTEWLQPVEQPLEIPDFIRPYILFVVGINGSGKTTTIGKLAARYKAQGRKVLLAAGDTFRAAATDQLRQWAQRIDVPIVAQQEGADPASVIFDAVTSATQRGADLVIADTAGRLHTQSHLMEELRKVKRVIQKHDPYAPHESLLVLDGTQGGNGLVQAQQFHEALGLTGVAVTKLDGTARGGILLALAKQLSLPVRYIGIGESVDDLIPFNASAFSRALVDGASGERSH